MSSQVTPPDNNNYPPTSYCTYIKEALAKSSRESNSIDQSVLRRCLGLSSSFLITDTTTDEVNGFHTWSTGFQHLVDVAVALHARDELELETMNEASKACSQCWSVSSSWAGLSEGREVVKNIALKLRRLLDERGQFRGHPVYAPRR